MVFIYHRVKKSVESILLFNINTAEVNMSFFFFPTKSPQLKTACYLRKLVTVLYLSLTKALLSVFGRFFCYERKLFIYLFFFKKKYIFKGWTFL